MNNQYCFLVFLFFNQINQESLVQKEEKITKILMVFVCKSIPFLQDKQNIVEYCR